MPIITAEEQLRDRQSDNSRPYNLRAHNQDPHNSKMDKISLDDSMSLLNSAKNNVMSEFFTIGIFEDIDLTMALFHTYLPNLFKNGSAEPSRKNMKLEIGKKLDKFENRFTEKERKYLESEVLFREIELYKTIIWKFQTQLSLMDYLE